MDDVGYGCWTLTKFTLIFFSNLVFLLKSSLSWFRKKLSFNGDLWCPVPDDPLLEGRKQWS